jgi:hypothetical protein
MALLGPNKPSRSTVAVREFWAWWLADGSALVSTAVASEDFRALDGYLSNRIAKINPNLVWEVEPGVRAGHRLLISGDGIPEVRPYAFRWLRGAPPADSTWEYVAGRSRLATGKVARILGQQIDPSLARFRIRIFPKTHRILVSCFHPGFTGLSPLAATHAAALLLDWVVGESDVARWVNGIFAARSDPPQSVDSGELLTAIESVAVPPRPERWRKLNGKLHGIPIIARLQVAARWVDYLPFDSHLCVRIPYKPARGPFPSRDDEVRMMSVDNDLKGRLGARGVKIARAYSAKVCTLHYYVDSEDQDMRDIVELWASDNRIKNVALSLDPSWNHVTYLTGV